MLEQMQPGREGSRAEAIQKQENREVAAEGGGGRLWR